MSEASVVALISGSAVVLGSSITGIISGFLTSSKTAYRINQLEKKVDKHNCLVERMVVVEQSTKSAHHRLDELVEREVKT